MNGKLGRIFRPLSRARAAAPERVGAGIALVHDSFNPQLAAGAEQGIRDALAGSDVPLLVRPLPRGLADRAAALRALLQQDGPAGVVLLPPLADGEAAAAVCRALACPYVRLVAGPTSDPGTCLVAGDRAGAAGAVDHLVAHGHRRIGFVAGPDDDLCARERELGFLDAMAAHGLDRGPMLVAQGDYSFEAGLAAGRLLLDVSPRPTAVFASNDGMAVGVLQAAREAKIAVPHGLSIVGFGDTPIASRLDPELTTVRPPAAAMGHAAARWLTGSDPGQTRFACELVVRGSTAAAA